MAKSIAQFLRVLFAVGNGGSFANNVGGAATHATFIPLITWFAAHAEHVVTFSASYGFELLRRSSPHD
jgi:hypothetical protein